MANISVRAIFCHTIYVLGIAISISCPLIFQFIAVPLLGWETIVGKTNVIYDHDHTRILAITNDAATVLWWMWIASIGFTIASIGKMFLGNSRSRIAGFVGLLIASICLGAIVYSYCCAHINNM